MALTPQDVADTLNAAGMDAPEKFAAFIEMAAPVLRRNALSYQVQAVQAERQVANQDFDRRIQALATQIADLDRTLSGR